MDQERSPSPARATLFYSASLMALIAFGSMLQSYLKLPGFVAAQVLIFLGMAVFFTLFVGGPSLASLFRLRMLNPVGWLKSVLLGLLAWALAHSLSTLAIYLVTALGGKIPELYTLITQASFPVALLTGALVPAICEETAFRGYLQWNLGRLGPRAAVVMTAILFGMMHMSIIRLLPLTLLGLIFSGAVQRTGSLLPGMTMHFVHNATALSLTFYFRSTGAAANGAVTPSLGSALLLAMAAIALGALAWTLARTFGPHDLAHPPAAAEGAPAPETAMQRAERHVLAIALPLLPAVAIYIWAVYNELAVVF